MDINNESLLSDYENVDLSENVNQNLLTNINQDSSNNEVLNVIYNLTGIKEEYFNIFFQDIFQQNWGVKLEDVINNDKMNIYLGFFTDEINEIIDQYDNIIINNIIESEDTVTDSVEQQNDDNSYEEEVSYYKKFKTCKQINEILGKSEKIKKDDELLKKDCSCFICLGDFKQKQLKRKLICGHHFHKKCIDKWFKISARCPICRKEYL